MHAYDSDFAGWANDQAQALASHNLASLDLENLAEEIATLGRSERRELRSRIAVLLMHLLKWRFQHAQRSRSWLSTINTQRSAINDVLDDSPSLRNETDGMVRKGYAEAVRRAIDETGLTESAFPYECPFSFDDIMTVALTL